jgi:hypothetical protein
MSLPDPLRVARTGLVLLALGPLVASSVRAQEPSPKPAVPASAPAAAPTELESAFAKLQAEFAAALAAAGERAAEPEGAPPAKTPQAEFLPRYSELALRGHLPAVLWCLQQARAAGLAGEELALRKVGWYASLLAASDPRVKLSSVLQQLQGDAQRELGVERALQLCEDAGPKQASNEDRATLVLYQARICAAGGSNAGAGNAFAARARELYLRVGSLYPDTAAARTAAGALFKLDKLQVGMEAPDYATSDVDGHEFKLSDYRGKIVVLDFWGFW